MYYSMAHRNFGHWHTTRPCACASVPVVLLLHLSNLFKSRPQKKISFDRGKKNENLTSLKHFWFKKLLILMRIERHKIVDSTVQLTR